MPCNALWWVIQAHQHANLSLFLPWTVIFSLNLLMKLAMFTWVPSYLMCLFGSWSLKDFFSMPLVDSCHAFFLLWYVPVACCLIALNFATWCYFCHVQWFLLSLWNSYYLQSCHILLSMFQWFLEISQCSYFFMLYMYITSMPFVFMLWWCSIFAWCLQDA